MKLKNISKEERHVLPNDGTRSFSCAPGAESPELADVCAEQLAKELPDIWALVPAKKLPKKEK